MVTQASNAPQPLRKGVHDAAVLCETRNTHAVPVGWPGHDSATLPAAAWDVASFSNSTM